VRPRRLSDVVVRPLNFTVSWRVMFTSLLRPNALTSGAFLVSLLFSAPLLASNAFTCAPRTLKHGDTLVLTFTVPHSADLALVTPQGRFYFLVFPPETPAESRPDEAAQPLVPWDSFKGVNRLIIETGTFRWVPWGEKAGTRRFVFDEPGDYGFQIGNFQETTVRPPIVRCIVHFGGRAS
jgi:hypothetical protein